MNNKYAEIIKDLSEKKLLFHLYLTQIILLVISIVLGGLFFNSFQEFFRLFHWNDLNILLLGGSAGLIVVVFDIVCMKLLPPSYFDDGGLNEKIFRNRSIAHIAFIAAVVAVCEELLFRGIIQTQFGLVTASIVFALIHYRYLYKWFLFINITLLSFFIGYVFLLADNLFVSMFMHFLIDFLLGLIIKFRKPK